MKRIDFDRKRIGIIAILMLGASTLVLSVSAQANRSSIGGMVFDEQRSPVREVQVELLNDFNSVIQRTRTDGSGRFVFRAISWGRFVIRILPLGTNFEEQTQDVEIAGVGADGRPIADNVQVDIRLKRRRSGGDVDQVTGVLFAQDVPPEAKKSYETAVLDLDSNRPDAGRTGLENAIKAFPNYYAALIKLGLFYIGQQKFESAIEPLTRAVNVNERSFTGWYGLGYSAYSLNKHEAAIVAAQHALELEKNSVNAFFILGLSQRQLKKYEAAEKSLVQAKKLDKGKTSEINWNLALLYAHNLKRYSDAANELETYLKNDPEAPNKESVKKLIKQFREKPPASN